MTSSTPNISRPVESGLEQFMFAWPCIKAYVRACSQPHLEFRAAESAPGKGDCQAFELGHSTLPMRRRRAHDGQ
jgi:hypothetical protein